jgi:hypothetical protein
MSEQNWCKPWGFHSSEDSNQGVVMPCSIMVEPCCLHLQPWRWKVEDTLKHWYPITNQKSWLVKAFAHKTITLQNLMSLDCEIRMQYSKWLFSFPDKAWFGLSGYGNNQNNHYWNAETHCTVHGVKPTVLTYVQVHSFRKRMQYLKFKYHVKCNYTEQQNKMQFTNSHVHFYWSIVLRCFSAWGYLHLSKM